MLKMMCIENASNASFALRHLRHLRHFVDSVHYDFVVQKSNTTILLVKYYDFVVQKSKRKLLHFLTLLHIYYAPVDLRGLGGGVS